MLLKVLCTVFVGLSPSRCPAGGLGVQGADEIREAERSTLSRGRVFPPPAGPRFAAVGQSVPFRLAPAPAQGLSPVAYASTVSYRRSRRGTEHEPVFCRTPYVLPGRVNHSCNCLPAWGCAFVYVLHGRGTVRWFSDLVSMLIGKHAKPRPIAFTGKRRRRCRLLKSGRSLTLISDPIHIL